MVSVTYQNWKYFFHQYGHVFSETQVCKWAYCDRSAYTDQYHPRCNDPTDRRQLSVAICRNMGLNQLVSPSVSSIWTGDWQTRMMSASVSGVFFYCVPVSRAQLSSGIGQQFQLWICSEIERGNIWWMFVYGLLIHSLWISRILSPAFLTK